VDDIEIPIQSSPQLEDSESTAEVADVSSPGGSNLDRQLESLIEMFFASQSAPSTSPTVNDTESHPDDGLIWDTLASNLEKNEPLETIIEQSLVTESHFPEFTLSSSNESLINASTPEKEQNIANIPENNDYWSELPKEHFRSEPLGEYHLDHKSPSPLIYPQRPPKGRKSLASVELPNFRPKSKGQ
jgi:hypothetical protein